MTPASGRSPDVPLIDLAAQRRHLGERIDSAVAAVLDHGHFILGPEVSLLEEKLAAATGAKHVVSCASGTDALLLALMALDIGRGDAVFVPAFTFPAPAEVVALLGATPVFVDVDESHALMDPASLEATIANLDGVTPRAVIAVDLYGHPADYEAIGALARAHDMTLIADAAQSFGAAWQGRRTGTLADITTTSFYPAKPLGCYGDGGAIFTDNDDLDATMRSLRVHGQETDRGFTGIGINGRLDTMQAAILLEKLAVFDDEHKTRQRVATRYGERLANVVAVPDTLADHTHAWACYTIRSPKRDAIKASLYEAGIAHAVYYRAALNREPVYAAYPTAPAGLPVAEQLAGTVLSLPIHPYLDEATQDLIIDRVMGAAA